MSAELLMQAYKEEVMRELAVVLVEKTKLTAGQIEDILLTILDRLSPKRAR